MSQFPNKEERSKCWDARDALWKCLDDNEDDASKCQMFRKAFEENCKPTWAKHFEKRRGFLKYQEKIKKDGYKPITYDAKDS